MKMYFDIYHVFFFSGLNIVSALSETSVETVLTHDGSFL